MQRFLLVILLFCGIITSSRATHYRAGEITYELVGNNTIRVTLVSYTTTSAPSPPDADIVEIDWGDGTTDSMVRVNGNGTPLGNDIKRNVYVSPEHTYNPFPFYVISFFDQNRINNIININGGASVNVPLYLEDTIFIFDAAIVGLNNSPQLLTPPIDFANVCDTFIHDPAAFDPDGDSLTFELITPLQNTSTPVPGYQLPNTVSGPGQCSNNFIIDPSTGVITWGNPQREGIYNVAILIREYRNGNLLSTIIRDMQIIVKDENNDPPVIAEVRDTCVIAGEELIFNVSATDPNSNQDVTFEAFGGPLSISNSPATFVAGPSGNPTFGTFRWQTNCEHIRKSSYQVVFKASDDYTPFGSATRIPLTDLETWIVTVVAPPPENVTATAIGERIEVDWDNFYLCDTATRFVGYSVWRRLGSNPFPIDSCERGLAGRGYTKIAEGLQVTEYTDTNVVRGQNYCYRIIADFADRTPFGILFNETESLPSEEACSELSRDLPIITNVDVEDTDPANGIIRVRWEHPVADANNLDTIQFPGPYSYTVFRATTFAGTGTQIANFTSPTFGGLTTQEFFDNGLNTQDQQYFYYIEFDAGPTDIGTTETASSVFLNTAGADRRVELSWEFNVPWQNDSFIVQRELIPLTGTFQPIDTVIGDTVYTDFSVTNDSLYCYRVDAYGSYTSDSIPGPLVNKSQESCAIPIDTVGPCPPTLEVSNRCDDVLDGNGCELTEEEVFQNNLTWTEPDLSCASDLVKYNVYYLSPFDSVFRLIDTVLANPNDTTYVDLLDSSLAGCYSVAGVDSNGNVGERSNVVCVDNCPCYRLPNVFTPNGDGSNDLYTPIEPYSFVDRVDMKIFDRWGVLVYETSNPSINWDGTNQRNDNPVAEDTYYYTCTIYEIRVDGVRKNGNVLSGFIHLIRGDGATN